jgi:glutathione S-transferase
MANVVLHQWDISPYCGKVRKALRLKGIPYKTVDYNGMRAPQAARLATSRKLPVLDWDGQRIADSSLICAFLDHHVPDPPLYPTDRRDAALARLLEDWADESLYYFEMHFRAAYPNAGDKATELLCAGRPGWERHVVGPLFRRGLNKAAEGPWLWRLEQRADRELVLWVSRRPGHLVGGSPVVGRQHAKHRRPGRLGATGGNASHQHDPGAYPRSALTSGLAGAQCSGLNGRRSLPKQQARYPRSCIRTRSGGMIACGTKRNSRPESGRLNFHLFLSPRKPRRLSNLTTRNAHAI